MNDLELAAKTIAKKFYEVTTMRKAIHNANVNNMLITHTDRKDTLPSRKIKILREMLEAYEAKYEQMMETYNGMLKKYGLKFSELYLSAYDALKEKITAKNIFYAQRKKAMREAALQAA